MRFLGFYIWSEAGGFSLDPATGKPWVSRLFTNERPAFRNGAKLYVPVYGMSSR